MSSDARSAYDASNEVWPYFVLTILGVVLIPATLGQVVGLFRSAPKDEPVSAEHAQFRSQKAGKKQLKLWLIVGGWVVMAWLIAFVRSAGDSTVVSSPDVWDPYEILQVAKNAGVKEIRSRYRKLSLEFHPDKVKELAESKKEEIEAAYVEISKAYRALTDEVTRENYLQYGHPDGPQPVTHGIALPVFLFNPLATVAFIALYLVVFVAGVPLVVAKWPAGQQRTRKNLLQDTATQFAELLAKDQPHFINRERILREILKCADMDEALSNALGSKPEEEKYSSFEARLALLNSYLHRNEPQTPAELAVATETARLLVKLHDFATEFRAFVLCQRLVELRRAVIQAVPFENIKDAEYLQLRGAKLETANSQSVQAQDIIGTVNAAHDYLPHLRFLSAEFRVPGESRVTINSRMYLALKFLVSPLGTKPPQLSPEEISASDSVIEGLPRAQVEVQAGFRNPDALNKKQPALPNAVAPYYPENVQTMWYVYLYGEFDNKLMEKPLEVTNLDLHNLKLTREQVADGDDLVTGTLYIPLSISSPPEPNTIAVRVAMMSATYFGTDLRFNVITNVVQPSVLEQEEVNDGEESEDEIEGLSDIDTDTDEEDEKEDEKKELEDTK